MERTNTSRATAAPRDYADLGTQDIALDVYGAFRGSGFSDAQSQALTAQINRENNFQQKYLFGTHPDPKNNATNVGMLSWQGDRAPAVMAFMRDRGVIGEDGGIIPGRDALQAQTDFIRHEMETNPSYERTRDRFLANPDVEAGEAARVLGDNYIRWARRDPEYAASGNQRIKDGYALLGGEGLESLNLDLVRPNSRPDTNGGVEALLRKLLESDGGSEGKDYDSTMSGLMQLEKAFSAPETSLRPVARPASVQRGSGGDALSRFEGLASLAGQ